MEERLFFCVAGYTGSKCGEILRGRSSECRTISHVTDVSHMLYEACFSVGVKIIFFSSHLHVVHSFSSRRCCCMYLSSPSLAYLTAGHESKCPGFSVKFWPEGRNN